MAHRFKLNPVCGDSSDDGIIILFEDDGNVDYLITNSHGISLPITSNTGGPTSFIFSLTEGRHNLEWTVGSKLVYTMNINHIPNPSSLAFVSCDLKEMRPRGNPWSKIANDKAEAVVHLGDNVYCDAEYTASSGRDVEYIKDLYMNRYRSTWKEWIKYLDGIPHYFGIDDHEVTDSVQGLENNYIIDTAMECYDMYQSALTGSRVVKPDDGRYWSKSWVVDDCPVQMIFTDRPRHRNSCYRKEALELIDDNTQMLILAMGVAPFVSPYKGFVIPEEVGDNGEYTEDSCVELLDILEIWRQEDYRRRVVIISGDTHYGVIGDIGDIKFAISSPISNQSLAGEIATVRHLRNNNVKVGDYTITLKKCVNRRNYVILDIMDGEFYLSMKELDYLPALVNIPSAIRFAVRSLNR